MKKRLLIIAGAVIVIVFGAFIAHRYIWDSPKFALLKTLNDIKSDGIDGLTAHLTKSANEKITPIVQIAKSKAVGTITSFFAEDNQKFQLIIQNLKDIEWDVGSSSVDGNNAEVPVMFKYKEKFSGQLIIQMKKENGDWNIDGVAFSRFTLNGS